jgi:hypothetical protein
MLSDFVYSVVFNLRQNQHSQDCGIAGPATSGNEGIPTQALKNLQSTLRHSALGMPEREMRFQLFPSPLFIP